MSTVCPHTQRLGLNCVPRSSANTSPRHHSSTHGPLHRIHRFSHIRCVLWPWSRDVTKGKTRSHEQDDASIQSCSPPCCAPPQAKRSCKPEMREVRKASTLNGRDNRTIPKMLLPATINRFALHVHQLGAQSIDHSTDNVHFQAVSVLSVL